VKAVAAGSGHVHVFLACSSPATAACNSCTPNDHTVAADIHLISQQNRLLQLRQQMQIALITADDSALLLLCPLHTLLKSAARLCAATAAAAVTEQLCTSACQLLCCPAAALLHI
jgi:hypothetical protein